MAIKAILWTTVLALATAWGWHSRNAEWVQPWIHPPEKPLPIKFDNGTVRQSDAASQSSSGALASQVAPPGGIRKCKKGAQVMYTDGTCPPGSQEQPLRNGTVTVIPGLGSAKPPSSTDQAAPRPLLRDVLEQPGEVSLRDKRMQRAADQ